MARLISVITLKKELLIIILLIISWLITKIRPPIKTINELKIGDYVTINGTISNYKQYSHITLMNISDNTGTIKCIFFKKIPRKTRAEIIGRVTIYRGEKELVGANIK